MLAAQKSREEGRHGAAPAYANPADHRPFRRLDLYANFTIWRAKAGHAGTFPCGCRFFVPNTRI
jgi:hypothetical protein